MESNVLIISWDISSKWIKCAQQEVIQRFNLKPPEGYPNYPSYCFVKKNSNRYFRKHLGFSINDNIKKKDKDNKSYPYTTFNINDLKKFMIFRLKYGL
jgi:hypothetical protein